MLAGHGKRALCLAWKENHPPPPVVGRHRQPPPEARRQHWHRRTLVPSPAALGATFAFHPTSPLSDPIPADGVAVAGGEPAVEFVPPQRLAPAYLGLLTGDAASTELLAATMVDLAARGHLELFLVDKLWWVRRSAETTGDLLASFERQLLDALFGDETEVALATKQVAMASLALSLHRQVANDLKDRGLFGQRQWVTRPGMLLAASIALATLLVAFAQLLWSAHAITAMAWQVAMACAAGSLFVFTSATTPVGQAMAWRARGFRRFFTESENYHAQLAADAGVQRQYMGYAVVFGAVDNWNSAFAPLDSDSDPLLHGMSLRSFSSALSPASSRSSGRSSGSSWSRSSVGSFGSRSAGGGAGGGGGGSW